jgi:hypothetical protein
MPVRLLPVFLSIVCLVSMAAVQGQSPDAGSRPMDVDGRPLNLDFETGTLADWQAEGEAVQKQPIRGNTANRRRRDMRSRHTGEYWVGSYEVAGDKPQGTLERTGRRDLG